MKLHHLTLGLLTLGLVACQTGETDQNLFVQSDTNKDGCLSCVEICTTAYPRLFGRFDSDGDGRVTLAQVKAVQPNFDPKRFAEYDMNKDGTVTYDEFCEVSDRKGEIAEIFAKMDTNGDQLVDKAEAEAHVASQKAAGTP